MRAVWLSFLAALVLVPAANADLKDFLGLTIASVELSPEAETDSLLVLNASGLLPGEILSPDKIQEAVKRIHALGLFANVLIKGERVGNRVKLWIETENYPRLASIKFEGNRRLKTKDLKKEITLSENRIASPGSIKNNVERLRRLYESKGYLLATVETSLEPQAQDPARVVLTFRIQEGPKVRIRDIIFEGNTIFSDDKLRGKMSTKKKSFFRSGSFVFEKFLEDKQKVIDFYKKHGYIDAVIVGDSVWYSDDRRWMFIAIKINEGEKYYFGDLTWSGNAVVEDDKIRSAVKIEPGKPYNQETYDKTLARLHEIYQDEGYWYVNIQEKKTPRDHRLDVQLLIAENNPVHLRMINIEGNTKTKEKVIRRELKIKPNTVFKRSTLTRSLREVMMLNFFANVTPDWEILDNGDIDLIIRVEEKPTGQFSLGAGYSAQDKLVGTIGLGMPNFLGGGQTVSFNGDMGGRRATFSIDYFEPWLFDTPTSIGASIIYQERDYYDWFTEGRKEGSLRVGRRLRWPDNYFRLYSSYRLAELRYYDFSQSYKTDNADNPYSVDKIKWPQKTSATSLEILRDSRDLAQFATKGSVLSWTGELAGVFLGGNWNYWKQIFEAQYYYTPWWKFTISLRGRWGVMEGIRRGDSDVPYSERFTPGGTDPDGIIRGYSDSRVGPRSPSGGYLGGRSLVVYNLELVVPIAEQQFYALAFADAGNAYLTGDDLRRNLYRHFCKSFGIGFRVVAPMIGVIGFDFGYPLDGPDKGKIRPHFQIGRGF